jgi:hypothetical protein
MSKFVAAVHKGGLMFKLHFNPGLTTVWRVRRRNIRGAVKMQCLLFLLQSTSKTPDNFIVPHYETAEDSYFSTKSKFLSTAFLNLWLQAFPPGVSRWTSGITGVRRLVDHPRLPKDHVCAHLTVWIKDFGGWGTTAHTNFVMASVVRR